MKRSDQHEHEIEMLEQMIKFSGQKMLEEQGDRLDAEDDALELPQELQDSILKMIETKRAEEQKQKKRLARQELRRRVARKMAASIALVAAIGLVGGSLIMHVDAWKIPFLNFVFDIGDTGTDVEFRNSDSTDPVGIASDLAYPAYIPEGFSVETSSEGETRNTIVYSNQDGKTIIFSVNQSDKTIWTLYTNEERTPVRVNGYDGYSIQYTDGISLIWGMEDMIFMLYGEVPDNEIKKIAESVEIMK